MSVHIDKNIIYMRISTGEKRTNHRAQKRMRHSNLEFQGLFLLKRKCKSGPADAGLLYPEAF